MILTKSKLAEMLAKNYLISNQVEIIANETKTPNTFLIVYPYYMVRVQHFVSSGWSFQIFGETSYSVAKGFIRICDFLDDHKFTFRRYNNETK